MKNHYTSILGTLFNLFVLRLGSGFERVVACNRTQIKANWQDILGQENISKKLSDAKTLPWALSIATQEHPRQGNIQLDQNELEQSASCKLLIDGTS